MVNVYIFALIDDQAIDFDSELFNIERIGGNYDTFEPVI